MSKVEDQHLKGQPREDLIPFYSFHMGFDVRDMIVTLRIYQVDGPSLI